MGSGVMHITLGRLTLAAIPGVSRVRGGDNEAREEKAGRDARERLQADPAACTYASTRSPLPCIYAYACADGVLRQQLICALMRRPLAART